jgi:uncharacterized membrane protein YqaE (UPF0057 family)
MNKNKLIAVAIVLAIYFGPVGMLFLYEDVLVDSFSEMALFLLAIFGMIAAFYIGVNQPFGKQKAAREKKQQDNAVRKAA